ncbi:hypothetical protein DRI50_06770 [candidate division KSB1 bacterium]|nr:MAG: hypothetical protein DRI50_06770 [candidate division KSB1 bacterium]
MIKRKLFNQLIKDLKSEYFIIITGARQTGKTTLLKQLQKYLAEKNQAVYFINLEDPDYLTLLDEHPKNLLSFFPLPKNKKAIFLIDEIQYLQKPTTFLKYIYDEYRDRVKLFVSGSSAFYLDAKFKDSLAGRKKIYILNTLSLEEFLLFKGKDDLAKLVAKIPYHNLNLASFPLALKRELMQETNFYMTYGGYPRVTLAESEEEKQEILLDLVNSFVKKDILESGIKNEQKVLNLLKIMASQCGGLVNINNLSNLLRVSHTAVENYFYALRKSFLLYFIHPFSQNVRNEIKKMPKAYFADLGLRNMLLKDFRPLPLKQDRGEIYENFIFRQFLDRLPVDDIKFWRHQQGAEVDFILHESLACEVKYSMELINLPKYRRFRELYPQIPLKFIFHEGTKPESQPDDYWQF